MSFVSRSAMHVMLIAAVWPWVSRGDAANSPSSRGTAHQGVRLLEEGSKRVALFKESDPLKFGMTTGRAVACDSASLARLPLEHAHVTSATRVAAGPFAIPGTQFTISAVPAFCRVRGEASSET